jgi:NitT/TauT family transport system permease protein
VKPHKLGAIAFFVTFLCLWQLAVSLRVWSPMLIPPPLWSVYVTADPEFRGAKPIQSVIGYLNPFRQEEGSDALFGSSLLSASGVTLYRLLSGYLLGIALGLPLGLLTARFQFFELTVGMIALGLQTLPSVCWVPLSLLWFGHTEMAMVFVVIMGTVWSVLIATDNGVRTIPPIYARAAQTMGSRSIHTWIHVILPASLPFVVSGMKQGWAFAWRSLMAAEIYVAISTGFRGLGFLLHNGRELLAMDQVVGIMMVIIVIGLLTDKFLFSPWERFLHHRWGTAK